MDNGRFVVTFVVVAARHDTTRQHTTAPQWCVFCIFRFELYREGNWFIFNKLPYTPQLFCGYAHTFAELIEQANIFTYTYTWQM